MRVGVGVGAGDGVAGAVRAGVALGAKVIRKPGDDASVRENLTTTVWLATIYVLALLPVTA